MTESLHPGLEEEHKNSEIITPEHPLHAIAMKQFLDVMHGTTTQAEAVVQFTEARALHAQGENPLQKQTESSSELQLKPDIVDLAEKLEQISWPNASQDKIDAIQEVLRQQGWVMRSEDKLTHPEPPDASWWDSGSHWVWLERIEDANESGKPINTAEANSDAKNENTEANREKAEALLAEFASIDMQDYAIERTDAQELLGDEFDGTEFKHVLRQFLIDTSPLHKKRLELQQQLAKLGFMAVHDAGKQFHLEVIDEATRQQILFSQDLEGFERLKNGESVSIIFDSDYGIIVFSVMNADTTVKSADLLEIYSDVVDALRKAIEEGGGIKKREDDPPTVSDIGHDGTSQKRDSSGMSTEVDNTEAMMTRIPDKPVLSNEVLSHEESIKLLDRLELHDVTFQDRKLTKEIIIEHDLVPKYQVMVDGRLAWASSRMFRESKTRTGVLWYSLSEDQSLKVTPYLSSGSQGIYRCYPGYEVSGTGTSERTSWFAKGYSEESISVPISTQEIIAKIETFGEPVELGDDAGLILVGTSAKYRSAISARQQGEIDSHVSDTPYVIEGLPYDRLDGLQIAPEEIKLARREDNPDFANPVSTWSRNDAVYGPVTYSVFESYNKHLQYLFCEDAHERVWIAAIELTNSALNDKGLKQDWVYGGSLITPAYEYSSSAITVNGIDYGVRDPNKLSSHYVDVYEKFLSKVPLIQDYKSSKNEPLPTGEPKQGESSSVNTEKITPAEIENMTAEQALELGKQIIVRLEERLAGQEKTNDLIDIVMVKNVFSDLTRAYDATHQLLENPNLVLQNWQWGSLRRFDAWLIDENILKAEPMLGPLRTHLQKLLHATMEQLHISKIEKPGDGQEFDEGTMIAEETRMPTTEVGKDGKVAHALNSGLMKDGKVVAKAEVYLYKYEALPQNT